MKLGRSSEGKAGGILIFKFLLIWPVLFDSI
jgi:hypothetical protein